MLCALSLISTAWVLYSQHPTEDRVYRWDAPIESTSDDGLGGGISWALQGGFCDAILPRFKAERMGNLVDCEAVTEAVVRGFGTWASNHRRLTFHDLTHECAASVAIHVANATDTEAALLAATAAECGGIEVSITAGAPLVANHSRRAAVVYNMPRDRASWRSGTRSTAGVLDEDSRAIELSRMHFNTELCWYLDNSFCYGFHGMEARGIDVQALASIGTAATFFASLLCTAAFLTRLGQKLRDGGAEGGFEALEALARWQTPVVLFFLTAPLLWYFFIYRPCFDCYDFEAAVAHEIGHVLGFDHPDEFPWRNRNATAPMSAATCAAPLASVEFAPPATAADGGELDSIMFSLTKQRARACLSDDDLAGLNAVYPTCNDALVKRAPPSCVKSKRNVGALRFVSLVTLPFLVSFALLLALIVFAKRREASRFKRIQSNLQQLLGRQVHAVSHGHAGSAGSARNLLHGGGAGSPGGGRMGRRRSSLGFGGVVISRASSRGSTRELPPGAMAMIPLNRRGSSVVDASKLYCKPSSLASGADEPPSPLPQRGQQQATAAAAEASHGSKRGSVLASLASPRAAKQSVSGAGEASSAPQPPPPPPKLEKIDSRVAGSAKSLDRQLNALHEREELAEATRQVRRAQRRQLSSLSAELSSGGASAAELGPEGAALLGRFWKLFEPVVLVQAMEDGRIEAWQKRLLPAATSVVGFPSAQLERLVAAWPEGGAGADAARGAHASRKAWWSNLLSFEPSLLDFFVSLDQANARAAASLLDQLADFAVTAAQCGPRNPLNRGRSNRALTGLVVAPLVADRWRGLLLEWMVLQLAAETEAAAAGELERREQLATMREFLRALDLFDTAGDPVEKVEPSRSAC